MSTTATVTVYTKPACVQCNATYKALGKRGIAYDVVDISTDPEARDFVMALGYLRPRGGGRRRPLVRFPARSDQGPRPRHRRRIRPRHRADRSHPCTR